MSNNQKPKQNRLLAQVRTGLNALWPPLLSGAGVIVLLIGLWYWAAPAHVSKLILPSPQSVGAVLRNAGPIIEINAKTTLGRVLDGWMIGCLAGIVCGLYLTWNRRLYWFVSPIIELIRPIPPVALIPFFILWFGIGNAPQIFLTALGSFMVMFVNTYVSAHNIPVVYVRAASSLGASTFRIYRTIILPAIAPELISGIRVGAALAFGLGVAAEFIGAQEGIGFMIMQARHSLQTDTILLGILVLGVESLMLDLFIRASGMYITRWREKPVDAIRELRIAKEKSL